MLFIPKSVHNFFFFVLLVNIFKLQQIGIILLLRNKTPECI